MINDRVHNAILVNVSSSNGKTTFIHNIFDDISKKFARRRSILSVVEAADNPGAVQSGGAGFGGQSGADRNQTRRGGHCAAAGAVRVPGGALRGGLATITTADDLVDKIFARYIAKHRGEFPHNELTAEELGKRIVKKFLAENNAEKTFNTRQRIMLAASRFDPQTLSAVAWLAENGVDISCIALTPYKQGASTYIACERLIPAKRTDSYFIGFDQSGAVEPGAVTRKGTKTRTNLPRMPKLIEWGIVKIGSTLRIKGYENSAAKEIDGRDVEFDGERMTYNRWGGAVTGWSAICIYDWAVTEDGRTLTVQRAERMAAEEAKAAAVIGPDQAL